MLLCFKQLWKKFRGEEKAPAHLGSSRDYNVDMMPKVINISYFPAYLASLLPIWITNCSLSMWRTSLWWLTESLFVSLFIRMWPSTCLLKLLMEAMFLSKARYI